MAGNSWVNPVAAASVLLVVAGCAELRSERITDYGKPLEPTFYFLEKRVFEVVATYRATGCKVVGGNAQISTEASVVYTPFLVADKDYTFQIPKRALVSPTKATSFTIVFYPDRTIKSINSTLSDKTAEIVEKVVDTAASVAGIFFFGRPSTGGRTSPISPQGFVPSPPVQPVAADPCAAVLASISRVKVLEAQLGQKKAMAARQQSIIAGLTTALGAASVNHLAYVYARANAEAALAKAEKEIAGDEEQLAGAKRQITLVKGFKWDPGLVEAVYPQDEYLCPASSKKKCSFVVAPLLIKASEMLETVKDKTATQSVFAGAMLEGFPDVRLSVSFNESDATFMRPTDASVAGAASVDGLVLRVPVTGTVRAASCGAKEGDKCIRWDPITVKQSGAGGVAGLTFPQFGPIILVKLRNWPFQTNNIAVEFNDDGTISKFSFGSEAVLLAAAGSAARTAAQVDTLIKSQTTREVDRLKLERERLQIEKDIRDLKRQLNQ